MANLHEKSSSEFLNTMEVVGGTQSVTRMVKKIQSQKTGEQFYIKKTPHGMGYDRYKLLNSLGLPIPTYVYYLPDTEQIATLCMGSPLQDKMRTDNTFFYRTNFVAASLIRQFHTSIRDIAQIQNLETVAPSLPEHTSHPIKNFKHRFIDEKSKASATFLNARREDLLNLGFSAEIKESFIQLFHHVHSIITRYQERILRVVDDCDEDDELIFGDYKPENIIVDENNKLHLIDPSFALGSRHMDSTKFVSRLLLEGVNPEYAVQFFGIYDGNDDIKTPVYRGFSKAQLVNIDMALILTSYLGRVLQGDIQYRLIQNLCKTKNVALQWARALGEYIQKDRFIF